MNWAERDIDRELAAVAAPPKQIEPATHMAHTRVGKVLFDLFWVKVAGGFRQQHLHRLASQLAGLVTEQRFRLVVGQDNFARGLDNESRVGQGFDESQVRQDQRGHWPPRVAHVSRPQRSDPSKRILHSALRPLRGCIWKYRPPCNRTKWVHAPEKTPRPLLAKAMETTSGPCSVRKAWPE